MRVKRAIFIALALLLGLWSTPIYVNAIPPDPHAFWGYLTINGNPAPVTTEVEARGEGVITGILGNPITTTEVGKYGGPEPGDLRLIVQGDIQPLTPIRFYVNGVDTGQTYPFYSGNTTKLDLSVTIIGALIRGTVVLQGGERPLGGHSVNLIVKLFIPGVDVWSGTANATYIYVPGGGSNTITNVSANVSNHTVSFDIAGVPPGIYDIAIVSDHTLMNVKRTVTVELPERNVNFGTLKEGNCDNDRQVNALDFSILATTYGKSTSEPGWDARADFDETAQVNALDFSLLADSYFRYWAPVEI